MPYKQAATLETLDWQSPIPLYDQLEEIFRSWIASGKSDSSGCCSSKCELQKRYSISRMTVHRTLAELVCEGFLIREQGRGAFVVKTRVQDQPCQPTSFTEDTTQRGLSSAAQIFDLQVIIDNEATEEMGISVDLGMPPLYLSGIANDSEHRPLYHAVNYFLADLYKLMLVRRRPRIRVPDLWFKETVYSRGSDVSPGGRFELGNNPAR